jgi:hypothetical protein
MKGRGKGEGGKIDVRKNGAPNAGRAYLSDTQRFADERMIFDERMPGKQPGLYAADSAGRR